jgi:hypothetical protein
MQQRLQWKSFACFEAKIEMKSVFVLVFLNETSCPNFIAFYRRFLSNFSLQKAILHTL